MVGNKNSEIEFLSHISVIELSFLAQTSLSPLSLFLSFCQRPHKGRFLFLPLFPSFFVFQVSYTLATRWPAYYMHDCYSCWPSSAH